MLKSMKNTSMKHRKGIVGFLLSVITVLGLFCILLAAFDSRWTLNTLRSFMTAQDESNRPSGPSGVTLRNQNGSNRRSRSSSLRKQTSSSDTSNSSNSGQKSRRKLPGNEYLDFGDPAIGSVFIFVIILLLLFCCCRRMICDILACVCLYEICCDDGAIGGFDFMPL